MTMSPSPAPTSPRRRGILSGKGLSLVIEHLPCCLLSAVASMAGIPFLNHNTWLELGFAVGGAFVGEWIGHLYFVRKYGDAHHHSTVWRYAVALTIGLATWGAHQILLH